MGGDDGLVTVGLDDFAAKLVGPLSRVSLPAVGASVGQGEQAWRLMRRRRPVRGHAVAG